MQHMLQNQLCSNRAERSLQCSTSCPVRPLQIACSASHTRYSRNVPSRSKYLSNPGHGKADGNIMGTVRASSAYSDSSSDNPRSLTQKPSSETTSMLSEPLSMLDVDPELWKLLDLCTDEELEAIYNILHSPSPFSPVLKSLVAEKEPPLVELRGRVSVMHKIESRFRFLAADPASLLQGKRPAYRETLLAIRERIDVPCSSNLNTYDLETEIFVHILQNCAEYVQSEEDPDPSEAAAVAMPTEDPPSSASSKAGKPSNWTERLTAPFRFGLKELVPTAMKLGSAMTVSAVGRSTTQQLATQLVSSHMRYQAAVQAATLTARGGMSGWGKQALLQAAQKGLTTATARYSALRGALSFIGPVMWGWLAVDLALKAIGTDYARVIRAVYVLAQIRLVRTHGFVNPQEDDDYRARFDDSDDAHDPGAAFL